MKTHLNIRSVAIILMVLFVASGCKKDKKITTTINSDGSCLRTVLVNPVSDSSSSFPIPTDKSWEIRLEGSRRPERILVDGWKVILRRSTLQRNDSTT